jgi:Sensors of blue-light using FAD
MVLTRLIYYSEYQIVRGEVSALDQLRSILRCASRNNRANGITGALIFDDLWFIQALEGDREAVWQTFQRICRDERHAKVVLVEMREVEERDFASWWMGLATRNDHTEATFAPYLRNGHLSPPTMSAAMMLELMVELAKIGLSRQAVDGLAVKNRPPAA